MAAPNRKGLCLGAYCDIRSNPNAFYSYPFYKGIVWDIFVLYVYVVSATYIKNFDVSSELKNNEIFFYMNVIYYYYYYDIGIDLYFTLKWCCRTE
ncbi:unnamed protein product [Phytomonas sp. EM1]|nr:unnamed protein product [Phytomonas sp. EM1]|eukprot:CCW64297.1 unnamed protein product [Phytomonas sp. isolate EM1]